MKTVTRPPLDTVEERLSTAVSVLPVVRSGLDNDVEFALLWNTLSFVMPEIRCQVERLDFAVAPDALEEVHRDACRALSILECVYAIIAVDDTEVPKAHVAATLSTAHRLFRDALNRLEVFISSTPEARKAALAILQGGAS